MTQITHLEPDILECKVKWALTCITMNNASGGDGIPAKLFKILNDDAALNMPANLEYSAMTTGLEKVSFHSNAKKGNAIECSNYCAVVLISHAGKVVLKILLGRLQQYLSQEILDVEGGFRKGRGTRDQIANIH